MIVTVNRKMAKILTVSHIRHHPIATLLKFKKLRSVEIDDHNTFMYLFIFVFLFVCLLLFFFVFVFLFFMLSIHLLFYLIIKCIFLYLPQFSRVRLHPWTMTCIVPHVTLSSSGMVG